jgi:beta-glucosidase-like glycosyl hydrolase
MKKNKDIIKGGKADWLTTEEIASKHGLSVEYISKQIENGASIEMEHTNDPNKAREIAMDHLFEFPDYYKRLEKMEKEALRNKELLGLQENDKKNIEDKYFQENSSDDQEDEFMIYEFEQDDVESFEEDDELYKGLKKTKK